MNLFIKIILALLALFTPFAFAGAEPWAFSIMQIGIMTCAILWLLFSNEALCLSRLHKPVLFIFGFLIVLGVIQSFFPQTLLDGRATHPVTLMPLYTWEHISFFMTYLTLALLISQLFPSQNAIKYVGWWLVFCTAAVALCAVSFSKGEYIRYFTGIRAGIGPFVNRNHLGVFFALGTLAALGITFFNATKPENLHLHREQRQRFYVTQSCWGVICIGLAAAVIFTHSRGGMLSLLCGLFCFAFLMSALLPSKTTQKIIGISVTAFVLAGTIYWITTHIELINEFASRVQDTSSEIRLMLYESAIRALGDFPFWGIGIGAMPVALPAYFQYPIARYVEHLHNDWLELLLGVGYGGIIPVVAAFICLIILIFARMKHLPRHKAALFAMSCSALLSMSVGSAVDFHFFIPANAFVFFVFLGILCAPTYDKHHLSAIKIPFLARLLLIVLLIGATYIPLQKTLAWRSALFGKGLKQEAKLAHYEQALAYYPSPRFAVKLGNAYFNASLRAKTPEEQAQLRAQGFDIATIYLYRYPKEPDLSRLYLRTRPH